MSSTLMIRFNVFVQRLEHTFPIIFGRRFPPDDYCWATPELTVSEESSRVRNPFSLKDLIGDGMLWAVPKHRRTVEKRLKRKYGTPEYVLKILKPKAHLKVCNACGHDHEVGILCPHCYDKIKKETEQMQEKIQNELGLDPVSQDVIVLYDGEKGDHAPETWQGKRIVEMKKPRPMWFSKNLIQKTTQQPATTTEIKPTKLG